MTQPNLYSPGMTPDISTLLSATGRLQTEIASRSSKRACVEALEHVLRVADDTMMQVSPGLAPRPPLSQLFQNAKDAKPIEVEFKERRMGEGSRMVGERHEAVYKISRAIKLVADGLEKENNFVAIAETSRRDFRGRHEIPNSPFAKAFPTLADSLMGMRMAGVLHSFVRKKLKPLSEGTQSDQEVQAALQEAWGKLKETYPDMSAMRFYKDVDARIHRGSNDARSAVADISAELIGSAEHIEKRFTPMTLLASYKEDVEKGADPARLTATAPHVAASIRSLYAQEAYGALYKTVFHNDNALAETIDAHVMAEQKLG
jgi:hypothetical protein